LKYHGTMDRFEVPWNYGQIWSTMELWTDLKYHGTMDRFEVPDLKYHGTMDRFEVPWNYGQIWSTMELWTDLDRFEVPWNYGQIWSTMAVMWWRDDECITMAVMWQAMTYDGMMNVLQHVLYMHYCWIVLLTLFLYCIKCVLQLWIVIGVCVCVCVTASLMWTSRVRWVFWVVYSSTEKNLHFTSRWWKVASAPIMLRWQGLSHYSVLPVECSEIEWLNTLVSTDIYD